ncbi:hypothetical protein A6F59_16790 [Prescottella equi]|nr:hypothetical protein A6F59_16790 [Prescottella equi]
MNLFKALNRRRSQDRVADFIADVDAATEAVTVAEMQRRGLVTCTCKSDADRCSNCAPFVRVDGDKA